MRKLAAILAADVVGFSRLTGADEDRTLARLRALRSDLIDPTVALCNGRVVKRTGDGALVEFRSVVDAVRCAIDVQRSMVERNAGLPDDQRIEFRIGVHLGDVVEEADGDLMGDGVNIAARLEGVAEPGGICLSEDAFRQVRTRLDTAVSDLGETALKNIAEKVHVYALQVGTAASAAPAAPELPDRPSIAVVPFDNMSGDVEQEYFADGIVEDIITALSRFNQLFVIARNSSFAYKGRSVDVKQIGRELGVRYLLEGSVRKAGARVRITGQLIDCATGAHLWADRFDGELADVFDLQDQVTAMVVAAVAPKIEQAEIQRVRLKATDSLDAYDHYLRGMALFHSYSREANLEAFEQFRQAFVLDPGFAAAGAMAARALGQRKGFGWIEGSGEDEAAEALRLARQAASLGLGDAVALAAAGFADLMFGEAADGTARLATAVALNPNLAWAWHNLGFGRLAAGDADAAVECCRTAIRLSPQDTQMFAMRSIVAMAELMRGNTAEARKNARESLRIRPDFPIALCTLAVTAVVEGDEAAARAQIARLKSTEAGRAFARYADQFAVLHDDYRRLWAEALRRAGLRD